MSHISGSAHIGAGTTFGEFCVIEDHVVIGSNCTVGHHVVIRSGSLIGQDVRIDDHTVIGKSPMRAPNSATTAADPLPPCKVGDRCLIGTSVILYTGSKIGDEILIADLATIRENVSIGDRTIVGRGVAIENCCSIGRFCKLETNVYITAHSTLEDYVFVAPGVLTSNDNFVGRTEERSLHYRGVIVRRGGRLGVGAVILPGREIGTDGLVAGGAVVTRDTEPSQIVAGNPARYFRDVPEEQLLDRQNWFD